LKRAQKYLYHRGIKLLAASNQKGNHFLCLGNMLQSIRDISQETICRLSIIRNAWDRFGQRPAIDEKGQEYDDGNNECG